MMPNTDRVINDMMQNGMSHDAAVGSLSYTIYHQSVLLSTLEMFGIIAIVFGFAALLPWLAPRANIVEH